MTTSECVTADFARHHFPCRACAADVSRSVVDLGMSPLCQTQVEPGNYNLGEVFYPLHAYICEACLLVQLDEYVAPSEIFSDYPYFSSYSSSWVEHARRYVEMATKRFELDKDSMVYELASNDGYLLQHFVAAGIPCRGVEPAANVAEVARSKGIPTEAVFFGEQTARSLRERFGPADLILGNNVLAHVPDLNDFVAGMRVLLKPEGHVTVEFPHLLELMINNQFDTIYHEHFSYFSLAVTEQVFARHDLTLFDVETLPSHGGSLRLFVAPREAGRQPSAAVAAVKARERDYGLQDLATYVAFAARVRETKAKLLSFLIDAQRAGKKVVGYGAPGKGNTLLNYCGIGTDLLEFTTDISPHKYGRLTPGSRLPILHPDAIREARPDYVLILPWNLSREIAAQLDFISEWGGRCLVPIPEVGLVNTP